MIIPKLFKKGRLKFREKHVTLWACFGWICWICWKFFLKSSKLWKQNVWCRFMRCMALSMALSLTVFRFIRAFEGLSELFRCCCGVPCYVVFLLRPQGKTNINWTSMIFQNPPPIRVILFAHEVWMMWKLIWSSRKRTMFNRRYSDTS